MPSKPTKTVPKERLLGRLDILNALSEWACKTDKRQCPKLFQAIDTMKVEAQFKLDRHDENPI